MKLHLDANQQFQLDDVAAVTNLFDGQSKGGRYSSAWTRDSRATTS